MDQSLKRVGYIPPTWNPSLMHQVAPLAELTAVAATQLQSEPTNCCSASSPKHPTRPEAASDPPLLPTRTLSTAAAEEMVTAEPVTAALPVEPVTAEHLGVGSALLQAGISLSNMATQVLRATSSPSHGSAAPLLSSHSLAHAANEPPPCVHLSPTSAFHHFTPSPERPVARRAVTSALPGSGGSENQTQGGEGGFHIVARTG